MSAPPKAFVEAWLKNAGVGREHQLLPGKRPTPNIAYWTLSEVVRDWASDEGHFWRAATAAAHEADAQIALDAETAYGEQGDEDGQNAAHAIAAAIRSRAEEAK